MADERERPYEIERDRFGLHYSGPLEIGECIPVVPAERLVEAESELEAARLLAETLAVWVSRCAPEHDRIWKAVAAARVLAEREDGE